MLSARGDGFSRYNKIIERKPFAPVASAADDAGIKVITVEAPPAFVKDLQMVAITESPAGIKVGFLNIRIKPPQPYYLYVGDIEEGIELVDADYEKGGALLRKGGEQYWMYMGSGSGGGQSKSSPDTPRKTPPKSMRSSGGRQPIAMRSSKGGLSTSKPNQTLSRSYAERHQQKLDEMRKREEEKRKLTEEEIIKKRQNYQMELIRKGLTPLPIKLTPEMDQQLVDEGVLPPLE